MYIEINITPAEAWRLMTEHVICNQSYTIHPSCDLRIELIDAEPEDGDDEGTVYYTSLHEDEEFVELVEAGDFVEFMDLYDDGRDIQLWVEV